MLREISENEVKDKNMEERLVVDDICVKIKILQKSISRAHTEISFFKFKYGENDELLNIKMLKLSEEKQQLKQYEEEYPELFI